MKISKVIIALDMKGFEETKIFINQFKNPVWFKVGLELFYDSGISIIKYIKSKNHKVFLDLKLFDIPNVVSKTVKNLSGLGVNMLTIHALGGREMMLKAQKNTGKMHLLGVSILTSTNQETLNNDMNILGTPKENVFRLAQKIKESNLGGLVCSAQESSLVKNLDLIIVTPGIRREKDALGDQKRVMSPTQAKKNGSTYIVVGRPIINSKTPVKEYQDFVRRFENE